MGMPRKVLRSSRSLSPVTIHFAWTEIARFRNFTSLESRQLTHASGSIDLISSVSSILCTADILISFSKYRSNLSRTVTSNNSDLVSREKTMVPISIASSVVLWGTLPGFSIPLTSVLVSNTNNTFVYLSMKFSKASFSSLESLLIVSASTPDSASSIASSSCSVPVGYKAPLRNRFKAFVAPASWHLAGRLPVGSVFPPQKSFRL